MAGLTALDDIDHEWGSDTELSASGDLGRVNSGDRSRQRVLRRLLTNPGDYAFHPTYGAGLPARVGTILDLAEIRALIRTNMELEPSVSQTDPLSVDAREIEGGVSVSLTYVALPDRQPVSLSFDVSV